MDQQWDIQLQIFQLYNELLCGVKASVIHDNFEFILFNQDKEGNIIEVLYKGVWFMVDNDYLAWSCTVPPIKEGTTCQIYDYQSG